MKTKELYMVGGSSGVGKTTLVNALSIPYEIIHTGNIARKSSPCSQRELSGLIVSEIFLHERVFLDTHYASISGQTGTHVFYQGLHDEDLVSLIDIPLKVFILIDRNILDVYHQRKNDSDKKRILELDQIKRDRDLNKEYFQRYIALSGAKGYTICNSRTEESIKAINNILGDLHENTY